MSSSTPIFTALFWASAGTPSRQQDSTAAKAAFPYFIVSTRSSIVGAILAHCRERATHGLPDSAHSHAPEGIPPAHDQEAGGTLRAGKTQDKRRWAQRAEGDSAFVAAQLRRRVTCRPRRRSLCLRGRRRCASAPRRHGDVVVAQLLLEHRDRRAGIALLALADRDGGRVADRKATLRVAALRVSLDERPAIGRIVRCGLGVAAGGDARAGDQRGDCTSKNRDGLVHLKGPFAVC